MNIERISAKKIDFGTPRGSSIVLSGTRNPESTIQNPPRKLVDLLKVDSL